MRSEDGLKIRRCFVARPGCRLISADYSQVELRLMAVLADVKALKEAFAAGIDIHTATAMQVFGLPREEVTPNVRRHAKAINFGVIYGISQYGLAKQIGISNDEAKNTSTLISPKCQRLSAIWSRPSNLPAKTVT